MRRLGRWTLNTVALLSLFLFVGTCVLWANVKLAGRADLWSQTIELSARNGRPYDGVIIRHYYPWDGTDTEKWKAKSFSFPGFTHGTGLQSGSHCPEAEFEEISGYQIQFWFLFATTAPLPALKLLQLVYSRLRRRPLPGHCARCAYDLAGNVSGVCPECGKAIADSKIQTDPLPSRGH